MNPILTINSCFIKHYATAYQEGKSWLGHSVWIPTSAKILMRSFWAKTVSQPRLGLVMGEISTHSNTHRMWMSCYGRLKASSCDLNITSLLTKLNFSCILQLTVPRCCNEGEQRTSSQIIRLLFANPSAFRCLPRKYCSTDSKCSVIKGEGQETEIWKVSQGDLKMLRSIRHKFTRETWEPSYCITCLYYWKSFTYSIQKARFSLRIKRFIAQGLQPPEKSIHKPSSAIYWVFL